MRRPEVDGVLKVIQDERCTHINAVPTLYNWMLQLANPETYDLSSLKIMTYAGSPFPPELLKKCIQRLGPIFVQAYAMTEFIGGTGLFMEDHFLEGARSRLLASAGQAIMGVDVAVVGIGSTRSAHRSRGNCPSRQVRHEGLLEESRAYRRDAPGRLVSHGRYGLLGPGWVPVSRGP